MTETSAPRRDIDGRGLNGLAAGYRPFAGVYDEMMDAGGQLRPHWQPFLHELAELGTAEIGRRFAAADRHLRDSGVFHRVYDDPAEAERDWPLSHIPLLIEDGEWQALKQGLVERADLIESILADLYGPASLVSDGIIPAAAVAGSPEFLRPLVGTVPRGGKHLRFYGVDLGRAPDGRWWVIDDRTQAPSGSGYALENRLAMTRALPAIHRALNVERLAGFFHAFRGEMGALNRSEDARVCVLTPGPLNEAYFEHAYLARYLGFLLVEGEDLTVRGDQVYVRTVSGLKRADVIWRRLDADFADPLELNLASRLGVPGLVHAVRGGQVTMANSLGAGLAEARSLTGYLPAVARHLLGHDLALPNIATWWCGDPDERERVITDLDRLAIAPAYGARVPGLLERGPVLGAVLDADERARLVAAIRTRGTDFVGQEVVSLSTMPVWRKGHLEPMPFVLRVFLARTQAGWEVMPGGFCRVSGRADARAISMQGGGSSADVWVMSPEPVEQTTLLPSPDHVPIRRLGGSLPSRAADNLFWLARYLERAEATLRVIRSLVGRASDNAKAAGSVARKLAGLLDAWDVVEEASPRTVPGLLAGVALHGNQVPGGLPWMVRSARRAASVIRDRFSPDAWRALNDLVFLIDEPGLSLTTEAEAFERANQALQIIAAFSGLAQENMNRLNGWRFLEIGRRLERAVVTCRFVRQFAPAGATPEALDTLLELADSQLTYRLRYITLAARAPVIDLIVLDPNNPRSVAFQVERIRDHLARLPRAKSDGRLSASERVIARLSAELETAEAESFDLDKVAAVERELLCLSDEISWRFFTHRERTAAFSGEGE